MEIRIYSYYNCLKKIKAMATYNTPMYHWNYFLAIEQDLERLSRYIEFSKFNMKTFSIELTHLLLSASSEIDVVMKQLCLFIDSKSKPNNMDEYKSIINLNIPKICDEEVTIDRFGLSYKPWIKWCGKGNPDWWRSYNNVKHQRDKYFNEANLENTINSVCALYVSVLYFYKYAFSNEAGHDVDFKNTTYQLTSGSSFIKINADYYKFTLAFS
jgi:hypothetical protein